MTFDGWTSDTMTAYIAITAHYLDDDWQLVSQLISFAELGGSHTGANMADHIASVIEVMMTAPKVSCKS